jgi:hypothetical protein
MPQFDLEKTGALRALFAVAREKRSEAWIQQFYATVPDASLIGFQPQVQQGPDHFPYFQLAIPDPGPLTPFCVTHLLDYLLDNGYGIAIFGDASRTNHPEWVFSYGDLLSYSIYGRFDGDPAETGGSSGSAWGSRGDQVLRAAPSEEYLPARARRVLGNYLRTMFQHPDPKVALVINPKLKPARNLMINLTLAQYRGDRGKLDAAMRYLVWFVPSTYSLMPMPVDWSDAGFIPL